MHQKFCNGFVHVIKEGDTLYQLSREYRVPVALLMRANPYVDVYNLQIGQEICIPRSRPFPGFVPNFGRPNAPMPREVEEQVEVECTTEENYEENKNQTKEEIAVIADGEMSLADILERYNCSFEECMEKNNLTNLIIKENVVIMLPNKV